MECDSQAVPHFIEAMTLFASDRSARHVIAVACVIGAMLVLPFAGMVHCRVTPGDQAETSASMAEACCAVVCCTALLGITSLALPGLMVARAALDLKPVRLMNRLTRWVPPPRSIGSLA